MGAMCLLAGDRLVNGRCRAVALTGLKSATCSGDRMRGRSVFVLLASLLALLAAGCNNNPWEHDAGATNTLYSAASESSPRHLDPTASYWSNDTPFTYQVYEPPYGYHYLKRPFELVPKSAEKVVAPQYFDKNGQRLPDDAPGEQVAESVYEVPIKRGIMF